ncbi:AAA family ATPase [Alkaliphilus sp. B6464]|uniref:AAA family ATPase n=1 Tax=Alkaliphilus sp. B6464 TaxID=2731219 RepID=UPI001BAD2789|nr:AAA family ATPase [Alkaliphilus sp. B6464]QUH22006.1 AAA family ATPase [Alkaliphilus sp. B6464]
MSKVIAFWSVDGGVGKTTMSTNMALKTAEMFPDKKVALLDLNLFNPDIDLHLGLTSKDLKNMLDYFLRNDITFENIDNYMFVYGKNKNLRILTGLYDINYFDKFEVKHFVLIIEYLKQMGFDYIYIDINSSLNVDATFVSLTNADKVIIVGEPQYTSLRNIDTYIEKVLKAKLNISESKLEILINQFDASLITKREIRHIFGKDDIYFIQENKKIKDSINKSEPFVLKDKVRDLRKSIEEVERLINDISI